MALSKHAFKAAALVVYTAVACTSCAVLGGGKVAGPPPEDLPYGWVVSEYEGYSAQLIGEDGSFALSGGTDKVSVPVGEYRLAGCTFAAQDEEAALWRIAGKSDPNRPVLTVNPGKTTALTFGPPLTAKVVVGKRPDVLSLNLSIRGQAGEVYSPAEFQKAGRQIAPPRFEVRDERGEIIARGQFHYG